MPMISHGRINGAPTSPPTADRPWNRNRVSPNAASVPSTRHTGATIAATTTELTSASRRSWSRKASPYQCSVTPSSGNARMFESLKLNRTKITSGPNNRR